MHEDMKSENSFVNQTQLQNYSKITIKIQIQHTQNHIETIPTSGISQIIFVLSVLLVGYTHLIVTILFYKTLFEEVIIIIL